MNDGTYHEAMAENLLACEHCHRTIEAVCPRCGKEGDAVCPHCGSEYEPDCLVEDYGFRPATPQEMLAKFAALARHISSQRNSKFWWACFLIATGDTAADGKSMSDLAAEWRVGKACVSKICVEICARLAITPSRAMRGEQTKTSFRAANRRNQKQ